MDPNNQNPQVDEAGLAKLETDLKTLETTSSSVSTPTDQFSTQTIPVASSTAPQNSVQPVGGSLTPSSPPPVPTPPPPPVSTNNDSGATPKKSNLIITGAIVLVVLAIVAVVIFAVAQRLSAKKTNSPVVAPVVTSTPTVLIEETPVGTESASPSSLPLEITDKVIDIKASSYAPNTLTVKAGETIMVTNSDTVGHSVTEDSGLFDTGLLAAGQTKTFTAPSKAGSYKYHCSAHASMTATLTVE